YKRAEPSGAPVRAMTDDVGGRLFHMNSPSKPKVLPKLAPPPTTKFPLVLARVPTSPWGKVGPPPITKLYFGVSSWAKPRMHQNARIRSTAITPFFMKTSCKNALRLLSESGRASADAVACDARPLEAHRRSHTLLSPRPS